MRDKKRLIEKIRKLFAMAEQEGSPNEAMIAAVKARELLAEHSLTKEDIILNDSTVNEKKCDTGRQRLADWIYRLSKMVGKTFECEELVITSYGIFRNDKTILFVGVEEDAEVAGHVFNFLYRAINNAKTKNKVQFAYGFIEGVREKLEREAIVPSREMEASKGALVLAKKAMIKKHLSKQDIGRGHSTTFSADTSNPELLVGYEEGLKCEITPGIKTGSSCEDPALRLEAGA